MNRPSWIADRGFGAPEILWSDGERTYCRLRARPGLDIPDSVIAVIPNWDGGTIGTARRLSHELGLRDLLDAAWALRPLEIVDENGCPILLLEDDGGRPLQCLVAEPLELSCFLRLAVAMAGALRGLHKSGIVHKDVKPANVFVNGAGEVRLTGFGIASRLPRERQPPEAPEIIAGTLAYMAPEQTGRMNRSIDSRSDLYSLGVTFYQMVTGVLPFAASDPMGWVHCHIARRPTPPTERLQLPAAVSNLIMRLLVKTAEDRYQTAAGVERDLQRCLAEWESSGWVGDFAMAQQDMPDRLLIPEKLYGREGEAQTLLAAFDRVVRNGSAEFVQVSGHSGTGKSSVVSELHKALPAGAFFASGKFEQYKRNIPYFTLSQALQGLTRQLLVKSDLQLAPWRTGLSDALGANGRLITDLVPELALIVGEQPPVTELPTQDAQRRFQTVFRRFISVFAREQHQLVLFLDDLQWIDIATLDLLTDMLARGELKHVLLIGAYRDNEVGPDHPFFRRNEAMAAAGAMVTQVKLMPLGIEHLGQLIADTLRCGPGRAEPLARLVHDKTGGNPLFAIQFIASLAEEGMLGIDHQAARWTWNMARIEAQGYTDNVVDLMLAKLARMPEKTRQVLRFMACLGNFAETSALSVVVGGTAEHVDTALWPAIRHDLVEREASGYRFLHDRVQEAVYSTVAPDDSAAVHLRIGRLLLSHAPAEKREEVIFEIVSQLNRGAALIDSQGERDELAQLNLIAGRRAKGSAANSAALSFFTAGSALLAENRWVCRNRLAFDLETNRAECEFLTGALKQAEHRLAELANHAADSIERATIACLRVDLYTTLDQPAQAVTAGLDYLRGLGGDWSAQPTEHEARLEYKRIWSTLDGRPIEVLHELPLMEDPSSLATLDVLTKLQVPNLHTDANLLSLLICRAVNLSLQGGNSDGSCVAYAMLGMVAGPRFGDYDAGLRFGRLGHELVDRRGLDRFRARTYMAFACHVIPWTRHVRMARDVLRRVFETANGIGDLTYAAYSCNQLVTNALAAGDTLAEVQAEAERGLAFAEAASFRLVVDIITSQLQLVRTLRGLTPRFGHFADGDFDEAQFERRLESDRGHALLACWYWIRKLQAHVFAGDHEGAMQAAAKAQPLLWTSPSHLEVSEYAFHGALAHAAAWQSAASDQKERHLAALFAFHDQLTGWARNCRENFEHRSDLVGAEIARISGDELSAQRLYERAIRSSRANGFVHVEALACELAADYYSGRGLEDIGSLYMRKARDCYQRWGANGKVRQLEQMHPGVREEAARPQTGTIGAPVDQLDLETVMKVSQAVSGEIVLDRMLDTLMRAAIEHAGAERGILTLARRGEQRVAAEALTTQDQVAVQLSDLALTEALVPQSIFNYVLRTQDVVIVDDAAGQWPYSQDPFISERQVRSVLCLPLLNQGKLIGVLYLENNLAPCVFVHTRITTLKLLASEAAISLENSRLYRDLAAREARIRRLVDANIIGIFIWDFDGRIQDANDAFLRMLGYGREDLVSGRLRWADLTPPEWRVHDGKTMPDLEARGSLQAFEKELFRKDGTRVPVLIGAASYEEGDNEGVAFVLDLTERKQAERSAREIERRFHDVQIRLSDANRVASIGHLSASIAHEVNQPLSGIITNASTCLRYLAADPPNIEGAQETIRRSLRDGRRAADVITRLRDLFSKRAFTPGPLDLNEAAREVLALSLNELQRNRVVIEQVLPDGLPLVLGDRIQLQQVIMNLLRNAMDAMLALQAGPCRLQLRTLPHESGYVCLSVCDTGVGLAAESIETLFEPFYTTKSGGMGIGLSVSRSILERHGGRLWADRNDGPGATFSFTVPCAPSEALDS